MVLLSYLVIDFPPAFPFHRMKEPEIKAEKYVLGKVNGKRLSQTSCSVCIRVLRV